MGLQETHRAARCPTIDTTHRLHSSSFLGIPYMNYGRNYHGAYGKSKLQFNVEPVLFSGQPTTARLFVEKIRQETKTTAPTGALCGTKD